MQAPVTHILPLTTIRRTRLLPVSGRLVVRANQKVSATDVIAEARVVTQHLVLDIGRGLGAPADQVDKHVTRKVGDQVSEGDIIAGPVGLFPRVVRAPRDGRVVAVGGGQVLLELESNPYELRAGLPGQVMDLIPDRGAVIEGTGALIQGIWGNGRIDTGTLVCLARSAEDELTAERLDVSMRGAVVVGGFCLQESALRLAEQIPLRGLILSSLSASLVPVVLKLQVPVIVLDGFGRLPMNSAAYQILSTNEKRDATISALQWDRYQGERPEVIIPLPAAGELPLPHETDNFTPGQKVRIHRALAGGSLGVLVAIKPGQTIFPSGIHAPAAVVRLDNAEQIVVPLANLEVIQ